MTTAITKSDRIIKVVSREEWKSTITTFFDKVGRYDWRAIYDKNSIFRYRWNIVENGM